MKKRCPITKVFYYLNGISAGSFCPVSIYFKEDIFIKIFKKKIKRINTVIIFLKFSPVIMEPEMHSFEFENFRNFIINFNHMF